MWTDDGILMVLPEALQAVALAVGLGVCIGLRRRLGAARLPAIGGFAMLTLSGTGGFVMDVTNRDLLPTGVEAATTILYALGLLLTAAAVFMRAREPESASPEAGA